MLDTVLGVAPLGKTPALALRLGGLEISVTGAPGLTTGELWWGVSGRVPGAVERGEERWEEAEETTEEEPLTLTHQLVPLPEVVDCAVPVGAVENPRE